MLEKKRVRSVSDAPLRPIARSLFVDGAQQRLHAAGVQLAEIFEHEHQRLDAIGAPRFFCLQAR
jgi:hypothetical protein